MKITRVPDRVMASLGWQESVILGLVIITVVFATLHHFMKRAPRKTTRILFLIWLVCMAGTICILYNVLFP